MKRTMLPAVLLTAVVLLVPAVVLAGCESLDEVGGLETASTLAVGASSTSFASTTLGQPPTSVQPATTTKTTLAGPPVQPTTSLQFVQPGLELGPLATLDPWVLFEEDDPHLQWSGPWAQWSSTEASGGGYRAVQSSASVLVKFTGARLILRAMLDKRNGIAKLTLDGSQVFLVDLYGSQFSSYGVWVSDPFPEGSTHTLLIEWTGTKNPANISLSNFVQFDAVAIYEGTLVSP